MIFRRRLQRDAIGGLCHRLGDQAKYDFVSPRYDVSRRPGGVDLAERCIFPNWLPQVRQGAPLAVVVSAPSVGFVAQPDFECS